MSEFNDIKIIQNGTEKEKVIVGHSEPITQKESNELFSKEDSICKIMSKKIIEGRLKCVKGAGFFIKIINEKIPFNKCLLTNNHILNKNDIKINNKINIEYQHKNKIIEINEQRRVFTNEKLDYTCIEIFENDNI